MRSFWLWPCGLRLIRYRIPILPNQPLPILQYAQALPIWILQTTVIAREASVPRFVIFRLITRATAVLRAKPCGRSIATACIVIGLAWDTMTPAMAEQSQSIRTPTVEAMPINTPGTRVIEPSLSRAEQWGLETQEWERYEVLMQGIRGSVSPSTLSPIEVLGIHARDENERRLYAERWAMMMREDAERVLAFQRAYDEAHRRLFPDDELIEPAMVAANQARKPTTEPFVWHTSDRVLFFTTTQCAACDAVLERVVGQLSQFAGIDVFLVDARAGDEERIRAWASARNLDPIKVNKQAITLNVDSGARDKVTAITGQTDDELPLLVLRRGDVLTPLPISRF